MPFDTQTLPYQDVRNETAWIREQQISMLYQNCIGAFAGTVVFAFALVLLLWFVVPQQRLILWLGVVSVLTLLRLFLHQRFTQSAAETPANDYWLHAYLVSVLLSGATWGAVSVWMFPADSLPHQIYIALILGGLCANSGTSHSPLPITFTIFTIPVLLPYLVMVWQIGATETQLAAAMITLFLAILARNVYDSGKTIRNTLELQVQNAELTRELHYMATHDSLSDLINHGEFQRRLKRLAREGFEKQTDYSLVFLDIDLFKTVNDTGGHSAGDALLREIGRIMRLHTRSGDTAARVGGDEFALLLIGCPKTRALDIAESLRKDIAALDFTYEGKEYQVAASIGVTYGSTGQHSSTSILKAADAACYAAKEAGRNRVRMLPASDVFQTTGRFHITTKQTASTCH